MSDTVRKELEQISYTELVKIMDHQQAKACAEKMADIVERAAQTIAEVIPQLIEAITALVASITTPDMLQLLEEIEAANVPTPKKPVLRAPKYIGPVNKVQYTANNPPRRARSNC